MVDPNIDCENTTWSPDLSRLKSMSMIAAMPDAVAMAASLPSIAARRSSRLVTVGFPERV